MTPLETAAGVGGGPCWCCGKSYPEAALVRLGMHPEVAVCFACARFLDRRATEQIDALRPSAAARGRTVVRQARSTVIEHGWQHLPILGTLLRWIDKRLP
jgi:hypothetical protein